MNCDSCGGSLQWVGTLSTGSLCCPDCQGSSDEEPQYDAHTERLLDEGVIEEDGNGWFRACCCRCENWTELPVGPEEIDVNYEHYCGGSPRCCP